MSAPALHATLVRHWAQPKTLLRSSWFKDLPAAEAHAQAHAGVVAIEEIGVGIVKWVGDDEHEAGSFLLPATGRAGG